MPSIHVKGNHIRKSKSRIAFEIVNVCIMILASLIFLLPVIHVLVASVSDPFWLNKQGGIILWPRGFSLKGYEIVFQTKQFWNGLLNTLLYVVSSVALGMLLTIICGYVLSREDLLWRNVIMMVISFTILFDGGLMARYILIRNLGMLESRLSIIVPTCMSTFNLIMMRTDFSTVPKSLEESARLDGAGDLVIMFRIFLPLVKATIATLTLFTPMLLGIPGLQQPSM